MPKYDIGCPLEYGSEEREKLRLGYAHHVQLEAGTLGVLEVQYFHPLSISNLTLTCACCGKTLASYSGVYKHSQKCQGIHPNEREVGSVKLAQQSITATPYMKDDDGAQPNKVSPTGDKPNWMEGGFDDMESLETAPPIHNTDETENNPVKAPDADFAAYKKLGVEDDLKANGGEKNEANNESNKKQARKKGGKSGNNAADIVSEEKQPGKKGPGCNLNGSRSDVQGRKVAELGGLTHINEEATTATARETITKKQNNTQINTATTNSGLENQMLESGTISVAEEQCLKKRLRGGKGEKGGKDSQRQTRSRSKK